MERSIIMGAGAERIELRAPDGTALLEALAGTKGAVESPCGGRGLCGKCRTRVLGGRLSEPGLREREMLSAAELAAGTRLACLARVEGDVELEAPRSSRAAILDSGVEVPVELDPPVRVVAVDPRPPTLEAPFDDERRLLEAAGAAMPPGRAPGRVRIGALAELARLARGPGPLAVAVHGDEVVWVGAAGSRRLGAAVDIGTTTVVCYLLDLETGAPLGAASELNAQRPFGADVVSRIAATMDREGGLERLGRAVAEQLGRLIRGLEARAGAGPGCVRCVTLAGNTTMMHLLARVPPAAIASAPFAPAFLSARTCPADELGLGLGSGCVAILLPGVSGYVGADIVAGIAAVGLADRDGASLFLDIGTNGEIALGGRGGILCCAAAAGPAFEGAGIERGTGGVEGAIDSVWLEDGEVRYSTIGGAPAVGICGSGLLDALAAFLECGLLDYTGRVLDPDEAAALPPRTAAIRGEGPTGPRLWIDRERDTYLSQADVREAQLAKAAIAAGIDVLVARSGLRLADVERAFLAGGFGSYLDVRSALRVGLLPEELRDRVLVAGNTSGAGAIAACLSAPSLAGLERARALCSYVELSSQADFNAAFVERMAFPEPR